MNKSFANPHPKNLLPKSFAQAKKRNPTSPSLAKKTTISKITDLIKTNQSKTFKVSFKTKKKNSLKTALKFLRTVEKATQQSKKTGKTPTIKTLIHQQINCSIKNTTKKISQSSHKRKLKSSTSNLMMKKIVTLTSTEFPSQDSMGTQNLTVIKSQNMNRLTQEVGKLPSKTLLSMD